VRRLPLFLLPLVLLTACGQDSGKPGAASTTTADTTASVSAPITISVYFLRDGKVAAARRTIESAPAVGAGALAQLSNGPDAEERGAGLTSQVPHAASFDLSIDSGIATVDGPKLDDEGTAQLVYTLTQFPTVRSVRLNGNDVGGRSDWEELTPQIFAEKPVVGQTVTSPLRSSGTANTFEATFQVELVGGGKVIAKRFVTATSGSGTRGTFDFTLPFDVDRPTDAKLVLFEISAEDGSRTNVVEIPVRLSP
jgi:germination protein M